ncbi:glycoside hydrolase superfamily [Chytriomyces cf. hyalinus JEL632]|nr:glycoside hydrolase superfamily [Chytriomyces cf. hyalinus JEL632]
MQFTSLVAAASVASFVAALPASHYLWPMPSSVTDKNAVQAIKSWSDPTASCSGLNIDAFINSYKAKTGKDLPRSDAAPGPNPTQVYVPNPPTCSPVAPKYKRDYSQPLDFQIKCDVKTKLSKAAELAGVDESYSLEVTATGATITASTDIGAKYAIQSLSQLITKDGHVVLASIKDAPTYPFRGFMLDTARNFFTVDDIKRVIDGLAATKMNVFHWHIYDSQSFPIKWDAYPQLDAVKFKNDDGSLKQYSKEDVKDVVSYAFARGVRVIPEFELPGHNAVFAAIDAKLVASNNHSPWDCSSGIPYCNAMPANTSIGDNSGPTVWWGRHYCNQPPCGQLDIANNLDAAADLVDQLVGEVGGWFEDPVIHVGHDEINPRVYGVVKDTDDHPSHRAFDKVMPAFEKKLVAILAKHNKQMAAWDEVAWDNVPSYNTSHPKYDANAVSYNSVELIPKDTIVTVWDQFYLGSELYEKIAANGFTNIIASHNNYWYFDCSPGVKWCTQAFEQGARDKSGEYILYPNHTWHNWTTVYNYDPKDGLSKTAASAIKGGLGALWSETIKRHNLDRFVFPRAGALGERLWSNIKKDANTEARLNRFRQSLVNEHKIASADLEFLGREKTVYRTEWCDFNLDTPAQKTVEWGFPGQPVKSGNGSDFEGNGYVSIPNDYCKIAGTYKTNAFTYTSPEAIAYDF